MRKHVSSAMTGFSLVEILIVVAIIAIVTAIAVPNLTTALQRSKRSRAMAEIKGMVTALASVRSKTDAPLAAAEHVPVSTVLTPDIYKGSLKDPWGGDYLFSFQPDQQRFVILSLGKDRKPGAGSGEFDSDIIFENMRFIAPAAAIGK